MALSVRDIERAFDSMDPWRMTPMERYMNRVFREVERPLAALRPYWIEQPTIRQVDIGNAIGNVRFSMMPSTFSCNSSHSLQILTI
ncbi:unnamed protein product [Anisakis simplex]|uniref:Reverse transcriptase domain-containing protein n=1 Tax=Anisakis simplex TaxID=6269 RepID=A0A0M3JJ56_ANISI|nr:unnamed protein product [Anisakis simplex]